MIDRIGTSPRPTGQAPTAPSTPASTGGEPATAVSRRHGAEATGSAAALRRPPAVPAAGGVAIDSTARRDVTKDLKGALGDVGDAGRRV